MNKNELNGIIVKTWVSSSPRAVFLLVHGLGAHSDRWDFLADFFLKNNISSYALDLKGFGITKTTRGHIDSFDIYFKDILTFRDLIKKENNNSKIFLIGESMGALIAFVLACRQPLLFDGLVCISPAFKNRLRFRLLDYIKFPFYLLFNPKKTLKLPFDSTMCSRDKLYLKTMATDDKEFRFASTRLLLNILLAEKHAHALIDKNKIPTLFLIAGQYDQLVDPTAAQKVFDGLTTQDKTIIRYPEMYHALSIDLDRQKVFADILNWVIKRI